MNKFELNMAMQYIDEKYLDIAEAPENDKANMYVIEGGHKMHNKGRKNYKRIITAVAVAACLLLSLGITAYAADLFGIRTMFKTPSAELTDDAAAYIKLEDAGRREDELSCRLTESLSDGANIMATVNIDGGSKYIIAPTDANPSDSVAVIGISGGQTLREYAEAQGKKLLLVGARIVSVGGNEAGGCSQRMQSISDSEMVIFTSCENTVSGSRDAVCLVYAREDGINDVRRIELHFTLSPAPTSDALVYRPVNPDAVPGIVFGDADATSSPLGYDIRIAVSEFDQEHSDILGFSIAGLDYHEGGLMLGEDGSWTLHVSMATGELGEKMTLHFFNSDKQAIGDIEFALEK